MSTANLEVSKKQLIEEFHSVVAETESLVKALAAAGSESAGGLLASVEQNLAVAKKRFCALEQAAMESTKAAAKATDAYVHENPWQTIGIAAGLGGAIGVMIGLALNRR